MVEAKQLSSADAETLIREWRDGSNDTPQSEDGVIQWLAKVELNPVFAQSCVALHVPLVRVTRATIEPMP